MKSEFSTGDKVFAKVKGYPSWPARVEGLAYETPNKMRYHVYFYGTAENAVVKTEDLCSYIHNKAKLGKPRKTKTFLEAVIQIENELSLEEISTLRKLENSQNKTIDSNQSEESDVRASGLRSKTPSAAKPKYKKRKFDDFGTDEPDIRKSWSSNVSEPISASKKETESDEAGSKNPKVLARPGRKKKRKIADFECESIEDGVPAIIGNKNQTLTKGTKNTFDKPTIKDDDFIIAHVGLEEIKLPITKYRPNFENTNDSVSWAIKVKTYALFLKERLEKRNMSPEEAEEFLESYCEQQTIHSEFAFEILKTETKLLDLDLRIRDALNYNHPDLSIALETIDELADLTITPLMLKKHPDVVITIIKLRKYCGPGTSADDREVQVKIALIRQKAEFILSKFQSLFFVPQDKTFWQVFRLHQERFDMITKNMSEKEFTALVEEPKDAVPLF